MQIVEEFGLFFPANPMSPYDINEAKQEHLRKRRALLHVHCTSLAAEQSFVVRLPKGRFLLRLLMGRACA